MKRTTKNIKNWLQTQVGDNQEHHELASNSSREKVAWHIPIVMDYNSLVNETKKENKKKEQ